MDCNEGTVRLERHESYVLLEGDADELAEVLARPPRELVAARLKDVLERHDGQEAHWRRHDVPIMISALCRPSN